MGYNLRRIIFIGLILSDFVSFSQEKEFKSYTQDLEGDLKFEMIAIPAGEFKMGSPENEAGRNKDEGPLHIVKLSPFWMGKYEVTWDLFEPFAYKNFELNLKKGKIQPEVDAVTRPTTPYLDMTFGMGKQGFPAVGMTQYAAIQFCNWLYRQTGIFYRLPTEAEWEYASRAGTSTADQATLNEYAWYEVNSDKKSHPVGTKKPNDWGLYDMQGNVAEWTADQYIDDFYAQFKDKVAVNPIAKPKDLYPHVIRGGSFQDKAIDLRSASRKASDPKWKRLDPQIPKSNWWFPEAPFVGIRLVRPFLPPSKQEIEAYYNQAPIEDL